LHLSVSSVPSGNIYQTTIAPVGPDVKATTTTTLFTSSTTASFSKLSTTTVIYDMI